MNRLRELEQQALEAGQQWVRARLEEQFQAEADACSPQCPKTGEPLKNVRYRSMELRTVSGTVRLRVLHGYSKKLKMWVCPARIAWGLESYQRISPELGARIARTATEIGSYERASAMCSLWGSPISDGAIHGMVQLLGKRIPEISLPPEDPSKHQGPFSLVIMMDGWLARTRGKDWGASPRRKKPERLRWYEIKSAVIYRLNQRAETQGGRGMLLSKYVVATGPGTKPVDFGTAVHAEALRRGLGCAQAVYVVMDGAVWLWELAEDRFRGAIKTLDFHHAREHLQAVADLEYGALTPENRQWMKQMTRDLTHGRQTRVLRRIEELVGTDSGRTQNAQQTLERENQYFKNHRDHLDYQAREKEGSPRGSGAVESLGKQFQQRLRGCGQFWKELGIDHLLSLSVLVKNHDDHLLWN